MRDPLWLLARQWQLGELRGHDGGSPIVARLRRESAPLTRFCSGARPLDAANAIDYDGRATPLEPMVEAEPVLGDGVLSPGLDVEAGQHLLRLLGSPSLRAAALAAFPFADPDPSPPSAEERALMGDDAVLLAALRRVTPSGATALARLQLDDPLGAFAGVSEAEQPMLKRAVDAWLAWCRGALFTEPATDSSWSEERLEYSFAVAARFGADEEVVLRAPSYEGAHLDWHTFDAAAGASLGAAAAVESQVQTVIPAPVRFRGMPATRAWEFEDQRLDLGAVDAGPTELARLLVLDFALIYGNDWFLAPLDVPVGAITRVPRVIVTDTFGVRTALDPAHAAGQLRAWSLFQPGGAPGLLLMPPTMIQPLRSEPREDVLFLRDDGADVAWAIERVVELPSDRAASREHQPAAAAPDGSGPRWVLASAVPRNWIPLVRVERGGAVRLVAGTVLPSGPEQATSALGRVLTDVSPFSLFDEEVPREAMRVLRRYRLARWTDGAPRLWMARSKGAGFGQGASRLEYDLIGDG